MIEITHNDESGQERTTRARLDTGGRAGGLFGGLGGGMGMGMGMGGMGGGRNPNLSELIRRDREREEREEEEKKETDAGTEGAKPTNEMETEPSMPSASKNGSKRESDEDHMDTSTPPAKKPSIDPDEPKPTTSDPSAGESHTLI